MVSGKVVNFKISMMEEHAKEFEKLVIAMNKNKDFRYETPWTLESVIMVSAINGIENLKNTYREQLEEELS